jgi:hypothetical protein
MKNWSMGWRKYPVVHCEKPVEEPLWGWVSATKKGIGLCMRIIVRDYN